MKRFCILLVTLQLAVSFHSLSQVEKYRSHKKTIYTAGKEKTEELTVPVTIDNDKKCIDIYELSPIHLTITSVVSQNTTEATYKHGEGHSAVYLATDKTGRKLTITFVRFPSDHDHEDVHLADLLIRTDDNNSVLYVLTE